jgi:hypothetical protein
MHIGQPRIAAGVAVGQTQVIDAQEVQDCGVQVVEVDLVLLGVVAVVIRRAVGEARADVPPFRESCWHKGKISDDDWLPHFACKAVGDVLLNAMRQWPDRQMTVLCGHTHSSGEALILPNLKVFTGAAEYGRPIVQTVLEIA